MDEAYSSLPPLPPPVICAFLLLLSVLSLRWRVGMPMLLVQLPHLPMQGLPQQRPIYPS